MNSSKRPSRKLHPALDVADQTLRFVLGADPDPADAGIHAVGQREIDDPEFASEGDRRLSAPVGQLLEATSPSTGENDRQRILRQGVESRPTENVPARRIAPRFGASAAIVTSPCRNPAGEKRRAGCVAAVCPRLARTHESPEPRGRRPACGSTQGWHGLLCSPKRIDARAFIRHYYASKGDALHRQRRGTRVAGTWSMCPVEGDCCSGVTTRLGHACGAVLRRRTGSCEYARGRGDEPNPQRERARDRRPSRNGAGARCAVVFAPFDLRQRAMCGRRYARCVGQGWTNGA